MKELAGDLMTKAKAMKELADDVTAMAKAQRDAVGPGMLDYHLLVSRGTPAGRWLEEIMKSRNLIEGLGEVEVMRLLAVADGVDLPDDDATRQGMFIDVVRTPLAAREVHLGKRTVNQLMAHREQTYETFSAVCFGLTGAKDI